MEFFANKKIMSRIPVNTNLTKRNRESILDETNDPDQQNKRMSLSHMGNVTPSGPSNLQRTSLSSAIAQRNRTPLLSANKNDPIKRTSLSSFESQLVEADMKSSQIKISKLEQDLKVAENEKQKAEIEMKTLKEKHTIELRGLEEQKRNLEMSLKNSKTNEKLIASELDHLRENIDTYESQKLPEKDKEIKTLKEQIQLLSENKHDTAGEHEKKLMDMKFELETKSNRIDELEVQLSTFNETLKAFEEYKSKQEKFRIENVHLQNRIKDLELENQTFKDEAQHFKSYVNDSAKIEELERENRKLQSECDYFKATQEKVHLIQEELRAKTESLARLEKIIVKVQMENAQLKEDLRQAESNQTIEPSNTTALTDDTRNYLKDLEDEVLRNREKMKGLNEEIKKLKTSLTEKDTTIEDLQKSVVRLNAERNGYKNIIDQYDSERNSNDETKVLYRRIDEMEFILSEYKKFINDPDELKLCNNATFRIDDKCNKKTVETQVNFNKEIYNSYDLKINQLKSQVNKLLNEKSELVLKLESLQKGTGRALDETKVIEERPRTLNQTIDLDSNSSETIKSLEKKLDDERVLKDRLLTEFERRLKKIFRTFKNLTGFKYELEEDNKIKLTSALNDDHFLLFRVNQDYTLSLLETEFANFYPSFLDHYLKENHSIPSFISAIILDSKGFKVEMSI